MICAGAGARCFGGMTPSCGGDCSGAPLLPIAYVGLNLLFNISALLVLRTSGEAQACHSLLKIAVSCADF